jgi:hypothetical protein
MRKIILCTMLLILATTAFSQQTTPSVAFTKQDYLKKSKDQKTAAWVLLGGGTVMIGTGFLIGARKESSFDDAAGGAILAAIGVLSDIGSIPLFIASGRNKRKGLRISFRNETAPQLLKNSFVYQPVPSLTLKISL